MLELMESARASQRIPVLLFACVHYLLLCEPDDALAHHYPNLRPRDLQGASQDPSTGAGEAGDAFVEFVFRHEDHLRDLLATRSTQTNEVGRCNWFLFPFALIQEEVGSLARVDVGSSAGLTLLFSEIGFDLHPGGMLGDDRDLTIHCAIRGRPPLLDHVPRVVWSTGFDSSPVDLFDEDQVLWLEACVWPEQVERFDRLVQAIDLARRRNVRVEEGDAVTGIRSRIEQAERFAHPVVTTSWVLNYLTAAERLEFVSRLDAYGAVRDLSWVIAESPRETPELPVHGTADEDITVISLVRWRRGRRNSLRLATAHPHGHWINWGG